MLRSKMLAPISIFCCMSSRINPGMHQTQAGLKCRPEVRDQQSPGRIRLSLKGRIINEWTFPKSEISKSKARRRERAPDGDFSGRDYLLTGQRKRNTAVVNENAAIVSFQDAAKKFVDTTFPGIEIFSVDVNSVHG